MEDSRPQTPPLIPQRPLSPIFKSYNHILLSLHPSLPPFLTTLTRHTPPRTLLRLLLPIILSHILRILFPSMLFYYPHALADMKLARSSPHYYLSSSTSSFTWAGFCLWNLYATGLKRARRMAWEGMMRDKTGDGWCVLWVVMGILCLEGAYVQTCWTGSQLYAYYTLFTGGEADHAFLETFLEGRDWRLMAQLGLVVEWLVNVAYPAVRDVVRGRRCLAGVGYVGVTSGTVYAVKKSNKYFVVLEMLDVWVMGVWLVIAFGIVGMDILKRRETVRQQLKRTSIQSL